MDDMIEDTYTLQSIAELRARSIKAKKPIVMLVEQIVDGRAPDISPPLKGKARPFIQIIRNLRTLALSASQLL